MTVPASPLRPGDRLASVACTTKVVIIRVPPRDQPLIACGGRAMIPAAAAAQPATTDADAATLIGKRYVDASGTVELLCTSSGAGVLTCDGAAMNLKAAKPLPASD